MNTLAHVFRIVVTRLRSRGERQGIHAGTPSPCDPTPQSSRSLSLASSPRADDVPAKLLPLALVELARSWPNLPPHAREAILVIHDACLAVRQLADTPAGDDSARRYYQVCETCTAKWFTVVPVSHCPRCGAATAQSDDLERRVPPWNTSPSNNASPALGPKQGDE